MTVSIVIAAGVSNSILRCLDSIQQLNTGEPPEVVVVCRAGTIEGLHEYGCSVIQAPPGSTLAAARAAGIGTSAGDLVVVLNERYVVDDQWFSAVRQSRADVTGGPVLPGPSLTAEQWAMYLTEYSHCLGAVSNPALNRRQAGMVPGGNVVYQRRVFGMASMKDALWELDFHAALFDAGARFQTDARMRAFYESPPSMRDYLRERQSVSRDFAARRFRDSSMAGRWLAAGMRAALPPLLLWRTVRRVWPIQELRPELRRALPGIVRSGMVQALGEMQGLLARSSRAGF